jgi:hypothetical protein
MKKTYQGSCHCRAIRFECDLDLAAGTVRCNCGFCCKARFWFAFVKAGELRLLQGADVIADYQHTPAGKQPFLHFEFCSRCGFRPFTRGGALPQFGGEFYAVNVACLDGLSEQQLADVPVRFADGRNDDWNATPAVLGYL